MNLLKASLAIFIASHFSISATVSACDAQCALFTAKKNGALARHGVQDKRNDNDINKPSNLRKNNCPSVIKVDDYSTPGTATVVKPEIQIQGDLNIICR